MLKLQLLSLVLLWRKHLNARCRALRRPARTRGSPSFPLTMETLGGFHKVALEQVKRMRAAVARHQGTEELVATKQLFQRLSVTLMRGNAALLMSRRPDTDIAVSEVDGIILRRNLV